MPNETPEVCPFCSSEIGIKNRSYTCYNCGTEYRDGYLIGFPTSTCMSAQICQLERQIQQQAEKIGELQSKADEDLETMMSQAERIAKLEKYKGKYDWLIANCTDLTFLTLNSDKIDRNEHCQILLRGQRYRAGCFDEAIDKAMEEK